MIPDLLIFTGTVTVVLDSVTFIISMIGCKMAGCRVKLRIRYDIERVVTPDELDEGEQSLQLEET